MTNYSPASRLGSLVRILEILSPRLSSLSPSEKGIDDQLDAMLDPNPEERYRFIKAVGLKTLFRVDTKPLKEGWFNERRRIV